LNDIIGVNLVVLFVVLSCRNFDYRLTHDSTAKTNAASEFLSISKF